MNSRRCVAIAIVAVLLACLAACGGDSSEAEAEEGEEARIGQSRIPATLIATESRAEDIVDSALANDRRRMRDEAAALEDAAANAATPLVEAAVPQRNVNVLRQRAMRVAELVTRNADPIQVALAANSVSALMPELFERFEGAGTAGLLELDYLDREAQLRSLAHDRKEAVAAVEALVTTWRKLRPQLGAVGRGATAKQFAEHVAAMKQLRDSAGDAALQKEAARGLELVDGLERELARRE